MKLLQITCITLAAAALALGVYLSTAEAQRNSNRTGSAGAPRRGTAGGARRGSAGGRVSSTRIRGTAGQPRDGTAGGRRDTSRNETAQNESRERANRLPDTIQLRCDDVGRVIVTLRRIPRGTFMRGLPDEEAQFDDETPYHEVTLTKDFYIGTTEITQLQYSTIMEENPSAFYDETNPQATYEYPVESVTWEKAKEFCEKLHAIGDNSRTVNKVRLPTEAEWEYACRAGTATFRFFDETVEPLTAYAWYLDNSGMTTHKVAQLKPNPWGLYDIYGNVWEWCEDWYDFYPGQPATDPTGPTRSIWANLGDAYLVKVMRGGGYATIEQWVYSAVRGYYQLEFQGQHWPSVSPASVGFRIVAEIPQ